MSHKISLFPLLNTADLLICFIYCKIVALDNENNNKTAVSGVRI